MAEASEKLSLGVLEIIFIPSREDHSLDCGCLKGDSTQGVKE